MCFGISPQEQHFSTDKIEQITTIVQSSVLQLNNETSYEQEEKKIAL